ncbi:hypothetical protein [Streptomyces sp. NPDC019937]
MDPGAHYPDLIVREHLMLVALAHGLGDAAGLWWAGRTAHRLSAR